MAGTAQQIAPNITRVAVLRDPINIASVGQFSALQTVAPSFGVELNPGQQTQRLGGQEVPDARFTSGTSGINSAAYFRIRSRCQVQGEPRMSLVCQCAKSLRDSGGCGLVVSAVLREERPIPARWTPRVI